MVKETPGIPEHKVASESPVRQILNFLSSMQLGIILLLLLALISVFATLRPMEIAIDNVYKSKWFIGIMAFTALNLLLCTVERMGPLTRLAFKPRQVMSAAEIGKMSIQRAIKVKDTDPLAKAESIFRKNGLHVVANESPEGKVLFGEKGKLGYFGSIVTHLSLLLILLGAMYGGLTGFEDRNGGYAGNNFFVAKGGFRVDINEVRMIQEEDASVRPKVFSDVVITRGGQEVKKGTIAINQPLRFDGVTIYHSTFLNVSSVKLTDLETGETATEKFFENDRIDLDSAGTYIQLMQFFPNFTMRQDGRPTTKDYNPINPVLAGVLVKDGQRVANAFLQLNKPEVFETAAGDVEVVLTSFENAAVYSIAKNLGRPYLFTGSLLMVLGLYMSFFFFPRRFWAIYDEKKSTLLIGGRGYRNRLGVEMIMERMESEILSREGE